MRTIRISLIAFLTTLLVSSCDNNQRTNKANELNNMIVRLSEIEIDSNYLDEYKTILREEAEASVRLEPGVISIYPMQQQENPTQVRILEIYASEGAYKSHLKTPHFQKYKTSTLKMVKSLRLVDMEAIDTETMSSIFSKLKE
jgi:quinol monooxygenase YgiN